MRYDANGNTTRIGGAARTFVYDNSNRMSQTKVNGSVRMNYAYNGKGEQVRRYLGTANTYTVYDEAGHWLGDYNTAGAPIQQAIWLDDLPVGVVADKLYSVEPDHLGTPRAVIDPTRDVVVWRWDLNGEVFGNTAPNQDPDLDSTNFVFNLRYPGQRYDSASGLNYNYFRDYDPGTGRYVESDPIGQAGGFATYGYGLNQPTQLYDKYGLNPVAVVGGAVVVGAIAGCAGGCFGALVGDYGGCVIKKRLAGGKTVGQCNDECTPDPCEAAKSCISGCIAGAIIGGATAGRGVVLSPVAGYLLRKYFRFLFSPDFCKKYGLESPGKPQPIPLPDWLNNL